MSAELAERAAALRAAAEGAPAPYAPFETPPPDVSPEEIEAEFARDVGDIDVARWRARWPNFGPAEFACRAPTRAQGRGRIYMDERVLDAVQRLRRSLAQPLIVTSGYRTPRYNLALSRRGAAKRSYHMLGLAIDIRVDNVDPERLIAAARDRGQVGAHPARGVGRYPRENFVHLDWRPRRAVEWGAPFPARDTPSGPDPNEAAAVAEAERDSRAVKGGAGAVIAGGAGAGAIEATRIVEAPWITPELAFKLASAGAGVAALTVALYLGVRHGGDLKRWVWPRS